MKLLNMTVGQPNIVKYYNSVIPENREKNSNDQPINSRWDTP